MFKHKKKLGQNFLINEEIIKKIADIGKVDKNTNIIEIGPGSGNLTEELLKKNPKEIFAIEFDKDLSNYLDKIKNNCKNFNYKISDALTFDEKSIFKKNSIIYGNLPYNISLKLLIKWIYSDPWPPFYDQMILMFQKEVAQRAASKEGSKVYGVLSVLIQAYYDVEYLFDVNSDCFTPPPKVQSGVIRLTLKKEMLQAKSERAFIILVKTAFNQRRKTLRNAVKSLFTTEVLQDELFNKRAEALSVEDFAALTFRMS